MSTVFLISCGVKKRTNTTTAQSMYTGNYFAMQKKYANTFGDDFYILSAKYGLLNKNDVIEPYEHKLKPSESKEWAKKVVADIAANISTDNDIAILCGKVYRKDIVAPLKELGYNVSIPLEDCKGMGYAIQKMITDINDNPSLNNVFKN